MSLFCESFDAPPATKLQRDSLLNCLAASFVMPHDISSSSAGRMVQNMVSNQFPECAAMCINSTYVGGGAAISINAGIAALDSPLFSLDPPMSTRFNARSSSSQIQLDSVPPRSLSTQHAPNIVSSRLRTSAPFSNLAYGIAPHNPVHPATEQDPLLRYLFANQSPSTPASTPTSGSNRRKKKLKRSSVDTIKKPTKKRSRRNSDDCAEPNAPSYRPYQEEQWTTQFQELLEFKARHGHCRIPNASKNNSSLSRWVKRQRYQYKLKQEKKPSALSDERFQQLEEVGFVWDYHGVVWEERRADLVSYKQKHGDCHVPSHYPKNPKLSAWVKCQRRQYKRFIDGHSSSMTVDRFAALDKMGFTWKVRGGESSLDLDLLS